MHYEAFRLLFDEEPEFEVPVRPAPAPLVVELLVITAISPMLPVGVPRLAHQPNSTPQRRLQFPG
jgi:hypothetical protein